MKSQSLQNSTKNMFMIFFYHVGTDFRQILFTYPPPMHGVIKEQPLSSRVDPWLVSRELLGGKITRRFRPFYVWRTYKKLIFQIYAIVLL